MKLILFLVVCFFSILPVSAVIVTDSYSWGDKIIYDDGIFEINQHGNNYQTWEGVWESKDLIEAGTTHYPYLIIDGGTQWTLTKNGEFLTLPKNTIYSYSFNPYHIGMTITATPAQLNSISTYQSVAGNNTWYIVIPDQLVNNAKVFNWDNKLPVVTNQSDVCLNQLNFEYHKVGDEIRFYYNQAARDFGISSSEMTFEFNSWCVIGEGGNAWSGNVSFENTTTDLGDNTIKLGVFADNFNDGNAEGWDTATGGISQTDKGYSANISAVSEMFEKYMPSEMGGNVTLLYDLNFSDDGATYAFEYAYDSNSNRSLYTAIIYDGYKYYISDYVLIYGLVIDTWFSIRDDINYNTKSTKYFVDDIYKSSSNFNNLVSDGLNRVSFTTSGSSGYAKPHYIDNVRILYTDTSIGNVTQNIYDSGTGNEIQKIGNNGTFADGTVSVDLQINSSADNSSWTGWHTVQSNVTTGTMCDVPVGYQKRYFQVRSVLGTTNVSQTPIIINIRSLIGVAEEGGEIPSITAWNNSKTNNNSLDFTINISESINFNATANQSITTWNWYKDNIDQTHNFDNITLSWSSDGLKHVIINATNSNGTSNSITWNVTVESIADTTPPASITNLTNVTGNFWHNWTWSNPTDSDFNHTMIYLNNVFTTNVSNSTSFYNFTVSAHNTSTISTHTVDITGNINTTWVNHTSVIENNLITISNISATYNINEGDTLYIDAEYTDADGDTPTFADNSTIWDVNTATGIVSWQTADGDDGTYYWQINVSDGYGSIDTQVFTVTVNNTIIAPTLSNQAPSTPYYSFVGQNVTFNATSDQASNNEFLLDSAHQMWLNGTSPTYTNTTATIGEYNITLIAYNTTNSSLSDQFTWTWNVSVLQPPQNITNVTGLDQIHYNWDDYSSADYWNISQLDITIPFTPAYPILDGIKDACYECCCAYGFVGDAPNPYTTYGQELILITRNDTYLMLYADGEDNDAFNNDDNFLIGIDASNNNLSTDDRKFILNEGGTVTAKRWSGSAWLPEATNAQGVVVGGGTPGAIQYEMFIPVSELDTNFTNSSTVKFFMSRTHTASNPDVESYYPQTLINTTDATPWQSVLLSSEALYTYINNTTTSSYTVTGLDPFTWYQHRFTTINGSQESSSVNSADITLDTPSYTISGYIKDSFGDPIANADVWGENGYPLEHNVSNASGYYIGIHFHNGTYDIYANATGYALNYTTAIVAGANLTNVNVTLTPLQIIPPNPTTLTNFTYNHGVGFNWTVGSGNFTDSYNVSYNGTWYNETTSTFINKTVGAHGTAEIIVYAYNSTENGALSVGYLTDNVTVPNNAPVLTGVPDSNTNEDVPINDAFDLDTHYSDVDGDSPSYSVYSNNQTGNVTPSIDGNNVVSYSLAANWYGAAEIVYKVEDGYGANDTDNVVVTVSSVNDAPVLQPIGPQNVNEGQTVTIEVAATDVETPEVDLDFTCNRTDLFTDFSINGGWTEWVTNYSQAGVYHVLFTVSDGTDSDNETVVITVTDIPLTIDSYWNNQTGSSLSLSVDTGTTVAFGVTTNRTANTTWYNHSILAETDNDTTQANYTATFLSAGTFYINASATDGIDQTANTTFTVEVSVPAVYYNVSGYVFDTNATAISGATVSNNQTAGINVTNVSGYYVLSLENGSVLITATASGYAINSTVATVSGDTPNQNITLTTFEMTDLMLWEKLLEIEDLVTPNSTVPETTPPENAMPLPLFITWIVIMFVMLFFSVPRHDDYDNLNIGIPHILFGLIATTIAYVLSKQIINGQVVQTFSGISQINTVVITTHSVQISWLSYVLQFIGIAAFILTMILILAFINEHFMKEIEDAEVI